MPSWKATPKGLKNSLIVMVGKIVFDGGHVLIIKQICNSFND